MYVYVCMEYHQSLIYIYGFKGLLYELLTFTTYPYPATFLDTGDCDVFSPRTSFRHSKVCTHINLQILVARF